MEFQILLFVGSLRPYHSRSLTQTKMVLPQLTVNKRRHA